MPPRLECLSSNAKMHQPHWRDCTREAVCRHPHLPFRPDVHQAEYFDNWVPKLGLLCAEKSHIGFLGSCIFIGIMASTFWVPNVADTYGRRLPALCSILIQLIGFIIIAFADSLHWAYLGMILFGMSFPGKLVVHFNYCIELCPSQYKANLIFIYYLIENVVVVFAVTFYYQNISKSHIYINNFATLTTLGSLIYVYMHLIESPIFLVNKMKFDEARVNLAKIAAFNGLSETFEDIVFTKEAEINRSMQAIPPTVN